MKQIIVLPIIILISVLAGIFPSKKYTSILFEHTAYYFIFATFFLWTACLGRLYFAKLKSILLNHCGGLLLSVILIAFIFCIAPPKFKVLADETNLVGISMAMHQSKKASLPLRGFNIDYRKPDYDSQIDKRPIFFPFLVSLVHALRGYSANNGFVVNFICGVLILFIFYLFIKNHFPRLYAYLGILMVASLPNFVVWITSSGFEALNLLFIVLTLFLFNKSISTRSMQHVEFLFLTLVLVSQCRYESVIFALAIFFLLPILLNKESMASFSFITFVTPILFIPILWLPRLWANRPVIDKMAMGTVQVPSLFEAFSASNLLSNSSTNLIVFLGFDPHLGFSGIIAIMSIAGSYLMTKRFIFDRRNSGMHFRNMWLFSAATFCLLYAVQASFYLGNMTLYTQNRFALAYLPVMVFPAVYFIHRFLNQAHISKKILVVIFFSFHMIYFWPYGSQQLLVDTGSVPYEYNKMLGYLRDRFNPDANILVIAERPYYYIIHYKGAVDFAYANQNMDKISEFYGKEFDDILVIQKCRYDTKSPLESNRLAKADRLVKLSDLNLTQTEYLRISKLINPS
jgi:hypothetical protein